MQDQREGEGLTMESFSESYRKSGVDITAGYKGVKLMAPYVARTNIPGVVSDIGGFGGLFAPDLARPGPAPTAWAPSSASPS